MSRKTKAKIVRCREELFQIQSDICKYLISSDGFDARKLSSDEQSVRIVGQMSHVLLSCFRALIEISTVIDDVQICINMTKKYPWDENKIPRTSHLHLIWFTFENLCYQFKEKVRLFKKFFKMSAIQFCKSAIDNTRELLKIIDFRIGVYIKSRGMTLHEFTSRNSIISDFSTLDLLYKMKNITNIEVDNDIKYYYRDTARAVRGEIGMAFEFMADFFLQYLSKDISDLIERIRSFNFLCDKLSSGAVVRYSF